MVFETWVMTTVYFLQSSTGAAGGVGHASLFSLCRLVRLARLVRISRLIRSFPELAMLVKGLFAAIRCGLCSMLLMLITMFVFGILFKQSTEGSDLGDRLFPSVGDSMLILFLSGT